jgi:hypothetical protein
MVALNISLPNVHTRSKVTSIRRARRNRRPTIERARSIWRGSHWA